MMTKKLLALAFAVALFTPLSNRAIAQEDAGGTLGGGSCNLSLTTCGSEWGGHHAVEGWDGQGGSAHNGSCMLCQYSGVTVEPGRCHTCGMMALAMQTPEFAGVMAAARKGDAATVIRLGAKLPTYVVYNAERSAVQVRSACSGGVLASLRIDSPALRSLAQALPRAVATTAVGLQ